MRNTVLIWPLFLDQLPGTTSRWSRLLSAAEQERASRFRGAGLQRRWIICHAILRQILAQLASCRPADIEFAVESDGKPYIAAPEAAAQWHFNLSHSHQMALVGATRHRPLGVDIEHVRELKDMSAVAHRVFSRQERDELNSLRSDDRIRGFYNGWTRKESVIKATGAGMTQELRAITVSLDPRTDAVVRAFPDEVPQAWSLHSLDVARDYSAAVAIRTRAPMELEILEYLAT